MSVFFLNGECLSLDVLSGACVSLCCEAVRGDWCLACIVDHSFSVDRSIVTKSCVLCLFHHAH